MKTEVLVVGGGMAGLTAAAYLCRAGLRVAVLEKEAKPGGLVNSFARDGFTFDGGIRAIENSGIVRPMLRQLGIDVEFIASPVSVGYGKDVLRLSTDASLAEYRDLLVRQFPENRDDIGLIIGEIEKVMGYMDVLYGIDNPLFMNLTDPKYIFRTILPWMFKYLLTMPKVARLKGDVDSHLATFTKNQALIDMIAQHFFRKTPTFFALSYFSLYLDYAYPAGGTGALSESLAAYVLAHGGKILCGVEIERVDAETKTLRDSRGEIYECERLLWTADLRRLYGILDSKSLRDESVSRMIAAKAAEVADKKGGDSVFTLYLELNLSPSHFAAVSSPHFFYTPLKTGLSTLGREPHASPVDSLPAEAKRALMAWTKRYLELTTYEISCPAMRNASLAPAGKTGLIVSTLMDYSLFKQTLDAGWYDEFRDFCAGLVVEILEASIYPGLAAATILRFTSTPVTIERTTGNSDGAITGWAFTNEVMPAVSSLPRVASSVLTPIPGIYQAGQWSFSPSGLPISILTGKLAADRMAADLKKR
jgi:phytoene dehydrogenase-like protein